MAKWGFFPTINRRVVILNTCKQGHSWREVSLNMVFGGRLSVSLPLLPPSASLFILTAAQRGFPSGYSCTGISFSCSPVPFQPHHPVPTLCQDNSLWGNLFGLVLSKMWLCAQLYSWCVHSIRITSPAFPFFPPHSLALCNLKFRLQKFHPLQPTLKHIQQLLNIYKVLSSKSSISWEVKSGYFVMIWNWKQPAWVSGI